MPFVNDKDLPIFRAKLSREEIVQLKDVFQTAINELADRLGIAESSNDGDTILIQNLLTQNSNQDGSISDLINLVGAIQTAVSSYGSRLLALEAVGVDATLTSRVLLLEQFIDGNLNVLDIVNIVVSAIQPDDLHEGDHWWELTETLDDVLPEYSHPEDNKVEVFTSDEEPIESKDGDVWFKTVL